MLNVSSGYECPCDCGKPPKPPMKPAFELERSDVDDIVIIRPRHGVDAERLRHWLETNFQQAGTSDDPATHADVKVYGGNPVINATIRVVRM